MTTKEFVFSFFLSLLDLIREMYVNTNLYAIYSSCLPIVLSPKNEKWYEKTVTDGECSNICTITEASVLEFNETLMICRI